MADQAFQVCRIRVTRLTADGTPMSGASDGFIARAPITVKMTADYQDGVELSVTNGCGQLAAYFKDQDQLKKYNVSFELSDQDHELIELLTGEPIVTVAAATAGRTSKRVGVCSPETQNGVALEFWAKRFQTCSTPADHLYWHWFMPRAFLRTGDMTWENDFAKVPVEGYLAENPNFLHGSWTSAPWPATAGLEAMWGVVKESTIPDAADGYSTPT